jgi:hypothetical protein
MRNTPNLKVEKYRDSRYSDESFGNNGYFEIPCHGKTLRVVASDGMDWDHVSVSLPDRCPTWSEMSFVKSLFFRDDETVIQFHPAKSEYVNNHRYCLHMWRPQRAEIPLPDPTMVGLKELGTLV